MKPENRLCLWCKYIEAEAGFAYSEHTWNTGNISCGKHLWGSDRYDNMVITDNPLDETKQLYEKFIIARTCADFELKDELVEIVGQQ